MTYGISRICGSKQQVPFTSSFLYLKVIHSNPCDGTFEKTQRKSQEKGQVFSDAESEVIKTCEHGKHCLYIYIYIYLLTPPMIHPNDGPSLSQSVWVKLHKDLQGSRKGWSEHNLTQTQKMSPGWHNQKMCLCVYMLENL